MGFLSDFFGGKKSTVESKVQSTKSPEQEAMLRQLLAQLSGDMGGEPDAFTGKMAPDLSSLERTSLAALEERALQSAGVGGDSTMAAARGAVERGTGADQFDQEGFDKMFGESVAAPMLDMFKRDILPEMTKRFSGSASFGSDRMKAERTATDDLGKNLTATRADMLFKSSEAGKDRSLKAASLAPGVVGGEADALLKLLAGGGVPREVEGNKLAMDYQEFVRQQGQKGKTLEMALAALGISPIENTNIVKPGKPGFLEGLAPGIGSGLGLAMMASDRRLKTDVKRIGDHPLGIGIYSYKIKGNPEVGVMADEVLRVKPEAVARDKDGYLMVNYAMLTKQ